VIYSFDGKTPRIAESAFVSKTACVIGDVEIGENSGVWPGAVIRGDFASIKIGSGTIIEDNSTIHANGLVEIGDSVIIGHNVVVHGRRVGNNTMIANHATILDNSEIGSFCIIGAACLVSPNMIVPDNSLVFGVPGKIAGPVKPHQMKRLEAGNASYKEMFKKYREAGL
jgi:carbonic anhydrase/acetyltransferase-like protein (isoleucine patch superfamily)